MSILLDTLISRVQQEFLKSPVVWENGEIEQNDLKFLTTECNNESEFDPHNIRKTMYDEMIHGNRYVVMTKSKFGQILGVFESIDQVGETPWVLWGRILRMFSEPWRKPFKIFFLANTHMREFPSGIKPIKPENINGGYTYRCDPETIVIYRAEDATRVLIHELQHSCCLDKVENGVDLIEAETEAWAELFYIAIISQGKKYIFKDLLKRQSEWMRKQNKKIRHHMKDPNSMEFPWRYTLGKEDIWRRWNILSEDELTPPLEIGNSLRLTFPQNRIIKDRFKVASTSTIL